MIDTITLRDGHSRQPRPAAGPLPHLVSRFRNFLANREDAIVELLWHSRRYHWAYIFGAVCPGRGIGAALVLPYADADR